MSRNVYSWARIFLCRGLVLSWDHSNWLNAVVVSLPETWRSFINKYSRIPITQTFRGNRKRFELSGVLVTGSWEQMTWKKEKRWCCALLLIQCTFWLQSDWFRHDYSGGLSHAFRSVVEKNKYVIHQPRSVRIGKTVPSVLSAQVSWVSKTSGTVFPNTDLPAGE